MEGGTAKVHFHVMFSKIKKKYIYIYIKQNFSGWWLILNSNETYLEQ